MQLNAEKTQFIWLGTRQLLEKLPNGDVQLLSASVCPQSVAGASFRGGAGGVYGPPKDL